MPDENYISRIRRFVKELRRRKIFRVVIVYNGVAFIILQVADMLIPALNLPTWTMSLVFVLLAIGFIIAVVGAWAFEVTPEGVVRIIPAESETGASEKPELSNGGKPFTGNAVIIILLVIIAGILLYSQFNTSDDSHETVNNTVATDSPKSEGATFNPRLGSGSIAVLPFTYLAAEDSADYFSLGMTDELLSRLAQIEDLAVIGRTSVMQYRDSDKTLPEIGRELGVAHLLEGSVQLAGSRVRIQAQLIEAADGTHLWADTYTYPFENILDLQSRVARQVARELEMQLISEESNQLTTSRQVDSTAYRLYLQGRHLRFQETGQSLSEAVRLLRRSVQIDSSFAPAWATLATSTLLTPSFGGRLPHGLSFDSLALEAARRAVELDSTSAVAHIAMGHIHMFLKNDYSAAVPWLKQATELNPGLANTHREFGLILLWMGRFESAEPYLKEAIRIDPASPETWNALGWNEFFRGNHKSAKRHFEQALTLDSDYWIARAYMAEVYLALGQPEFALREARRSVEINYSPWSLAILGRTYARTGSPDSARVILNGIRKKYASRPCQEAIIYVSLGETERALNLLEKTKGCFLKVGPWWEPLRGEPRYRRLLERAGLDDASIRQTMTRLGVEDHPY